MKRSILTTLIILLFCSTLRGQEAKQILQSTIEAMGGIDAWKGIEYIQMTHAGHKHWMEQSENPNGPYITSYQVVDEIRGVWQTQLSRQEGTRQFQSAGEAKSEIMLNGDKGLMKFGERSFPMPSAYRVNYDEWLRYAPERLLLDGLEASLQREKDEVVEGTNHQVISYSKAGLKHRLYINPNTKMLYQAEIESFLPLDVFNYPWGKFKTTIVYSLNWLYPENIRYPAQWSVYKLGHLFQSITITSINFHPDVAETTFEIPADLPPSSPAKPVEESVLNTDGTIEVTENIFTTPGSWNVGHIIQSDGILVIEGPISSGYNAQHLAYLREKYPNKPIKAVFATSDAWPHVGGIRQFAAERIPIYTHRLNKEIISNILAADHSLLPDAYEKSKVKPKFELVDKPIELDDSLNPVRILPVDGEGGERMIMLYFLKSKVLYASDLVQYDARSKSFFSPQYLTEVHAAVERYNLDVETVFAFHTGPLPYSEIIKSIEKIKP